MIPFLLENSACRIFLFSRSWISFWLSVKLACILSKSTAITSSSPRQIFRLGFSTLFRVNVISLMHTQDMSFSSEISRQTVRQFSRVPRCFFSRSFSMKLRIFLTSATTGFRFVPNRSGASLYTRRSTLQIFSKSLTDPLDSPLWLSLLQSSEKRSRKLLRPELFVLTRPAKTCSALSKSRLSRSLPPLSRVAFLDFFL